MDFNDDSSLLRKILIIFGILAVLGIAAAIAVVLKVPQKAFQYSSDKFINVSKSADFEVKNIIINGRQNFSKDDVFFAADIKKGTPILSINLNDAAKKLSVLPWVENVSIMRQLPDTIIINLQEKTPLARWQKSNDQIFVIDSNGKIIQSAKASDFPRLPLLVGAGADKAAARLLSELKAYKDIHSRFFSAKRIGQRRWDLYLLQTPIPGSSKPNGIVIRLSDKEKSLDKSLHRLSILIEEAKILDRNLDYIDLRFPDQFVEGSRNSVDTDKK